MSASAAMPMAGRHIMSSPQLFNYIGHGGYCTSGRRAGGDPGTTDSGSRLTSHDVMLPAARAPSRALCEAILPISQQRAALLPRSSRAVAGAVGEGRRGGRQRAERRGELCACREEG